MDLETDVNKVKVIAELAGVLQLSEDKLFDNVTILFKILGTDWSKFDIISLKRRAKREVKKLQNWLNELKMIPKIK